MLYINWAKPKLTGVIIIGYKMVCIDLDGTLLDDKRNISEINKEAIRKATNNDIKVIISTGRIFSNAVEYAELLGLNTPIISSSGAVIGDLHFGEFGCRNIIDYDSCRYILEVSLNSDSKISFSSLDTIYTNDFEMKVLLDIVKMKDDTFRNTKISYIQKYSQWDEVFKSGTVKSDIRFKKVADVIKIKNEMAKRFEVVNFTATNLEITNQGVSKGKAIEILAKHFGVSPNEIIAIGDSENDLSMIKYAGMGIAMGNAGKIVIDNSDFTTETNNNNGVAKAINKFVFNRI
ncbi:MAG TPA: Cof-type HAD-IIB family hydrolase [Eubacteriaceae bacterium]|nr:Cof-type HAD-IIB family hydrolase [Eubacteriaceae bacterium]